MNYYLMRNLKVPYYEKHIISGLYIHKLVLLEPTNSQNEETSPAWVLRPTTAKTALLQTLQIHLLLLSNERRDVHRLASSAQ